MSNITIEQTELLKIALKSVRKAQTTAIDNSLYAKLDEVMYALQDLLEDNEHVHNDNILDDKINKVFFDIIED